MSISIFSLIALVFKTYIILSLLTLALSFSENRPYFTLSVSLWIGYYLLSLLYCNSEKCDSQKIILQPFRYLFNVENLIINKPANAKPLLTTIVILISLQDLSVWAQLTSSKTPYLQLQEPGNSGLFQEDYSYTSNQLENTVLYDWKTLKTLLFIICYFGQLILGLFLKALLIQEMLLQNNEEQINKLNFLNAICIFFSVSSLHGLFGMIFNMRADFFVYLITAKITIVILETLIICHYKMLVFNNQALFRDVIIVLAVVQLIFNAPFEFSPFYQQLLKVETTTQANLHSQDSMTVVRVGSTIEIVLLVSLVQYLSVGHGILQGDVLKYLMYFFIVSAVISVVLSMYHLFLKFQEKLSKNYRMYKIQSMRIDDAIQILRKSKNLLYFQVDFLIDQQLTLENDNQKAKQKELLQALLAHTSYDSLSFKSFKLGQLIQMSSTKRSNEKYFNFLAIDHTSIFDSSFLSELSDFSRPLLFCKFQPNLDMKLRYLFSQCFCERVFAEGVSQQTQDFISIQYFYHKQNCKTLVNYFLKNTATVIIFHRLFSPLFQTNPEQVIHDLWFDDSLYE